MLTEIAIKAAKSRSKQYRMADALGLYLLVRPDGARWWRWDYRRPNGKRNTLSLGVYPDVSLKKGARQARRGASPGEGWRRSWRQTPGTKGRARRQLRSSGSGMVREVLAKMGADSLQQDHHAAGEGHLPLARVATCECDYTAGTTHVLASDRGFAVRSIPPIEPIRIAARCFAMPSQPGAPNAIPPAICVALFRRQPTRTTHRSLSRRR